jgi:DNA-binding transcriptional LysR family regulator
VDLRYLQSFMVVVEVGSLAEAARRLDLTPAAVAARVRALEVEFGADLIRRSGRSVRPTEAGLRILERGRALLRDERDLRAIAGGRAPVGELRLGVFPSALHTVLPQVLKGLYAGHPDLQVFVAPGASVELCRRVGAGELDAALVVEPSFPIGKNCDWCPLAEQPLVVVAPQALADADPLELLRTLPYIRYDRTTIGELSDRYLRDHGIRPNLRLQIDGLMAIAGMIAHGLGVGLLPDWRPMWSAGLPIARLPLPDRAPVDRIGLIWDRSGPRAVLSRAFMTQAQAVIADDAPSA